ncbi:GrpE-domain-containing protein [Lyophyllum atratum]|nr:GrpE-domain-containing protein [Lyophyllum atratum]
MATAAHALQTLRSATASLSSRTFTRAAVSRPTRLSVLGRRHYSEEKTEEKKEEANDAGKAGEAPSTPEQLKLQEKEAEVVDLTARLRYLQADFLNLQRNAAREKEQTRDFAITRFAGDLLETADVLAMALKSVPPSALTPAGPSSSLKKTALQLLQDLHQGVEITQRQLLQTLFKYHVKPFDPTGDAFDPNFHEALYQAPIPGKEPGTVIDCQKIGYTIKDRVLRAAQVGVAQDTS